MPHRSVGPVVVALLLLALCPLEASADHYDFTVNPNPPNEDVVTTFELQGELAEGDRVRWDLDGDGEFDPGLTATEVSRTYVEPGPVTVRMQVTGHSGGPIEKTLTVNGTPDVDFDFAPASPLTGESVSFTAQASDPENDDVSLSWDFDDGGSGVGSSPSHAFASAGTYDVVLTGTDVHGAVATKTVSVAVADDPGPVADFDFTPAAPLTGDTVTFTSSSFPSRGSITASDWDLDGDGEFDDAAGPSADWSYESAGSHLVQLRVEQTNGMQSVAFTHVEVAERPPPPPPDGSGQTGPVGGSDLPTVPVVPLPAVTQPALMRPFPVVRIAGVVLRRGADISVLSVRAPRGALIRARCRGRGCPVGSLARTGATRLVRLRKFERRLRAGVSIEIFVRKAGTIGKYTRFLIRAGKPPARVDRCLIPGRERPAACP